MDAGLRKFITAALFALFVITAQAAPPAESDGLEGSRDDVHAAPDLSGCGEAEPEHSIATLFDERWHTRGPLSAEYLYTGEVYNNSHGGITTRGATRYRGNLDLTLRFDTELADWWEGGEFFVYMQQNHGHTLTPNFVGDGQYYSSIDTGPNQDITQLGEYWYRHSFADDLLSITVGRQDANEEFGFTDLGGDFINSSFLTMANVPLPTWPYQTLGGSALYQPNSKLRLGGGIYDHGTSSPLWWTTTTRKGLFLIGQADYQPFADDEDTLLTIVRVGGWFTSSETLSTKNNSAYDNN